MVQKPPRRRPAGSRTAGATLMAIATSAALAACTPTGTTTRPTPELPRPTPEPVSPVELQPEPGASFSFATGSNRYSVRSITEVLVSGDSIPASADSVTVSASVLLAVSTGDSVRAVAGSVLGSTIQTGQLIRQPGPVPRTEAPASVPFEGEVAPGNSTLTLSPDRSSNSPQGTPTGVSAPDTLVATATAPCTQAHAFEQTLLGMARETLPVIPRALTVGATWRDSVSLVTCRSSVTLISTTWHTFEVLQLTEQTGTLTALLRRVSSQQIAGSGEQSGLPVQVMGEGSGESNLVLDVSNGRLLSSTGQSRITMRHTAGIRTALVEQHTALDVQLQEASSTSMTPP